MKCNLFCKHCYRESGPDEKVDEELTTEEGKKLIGDMTKAGMGVLVFSGGEPLMRPDIFELIKYANDKNIMPLMGSNGTLITKEVAKKLKSSGLKAIAISLDSLDKETHDKFRGVKGSFDLTIRGIKNAIEAGLKVQINCTVSKFNLGEIDDLMNFSEDIGASSCHMLFLVDVGRGKLIEEHQLSKEEYKKAINEIISKEASIRIKPTCAPQYKVEAKFKELETVGGRGCIAGISYCSILPNGDVHICPYTPVRVDSIREKPFDEIWSKNEIFLSLRDYNNYKGRCGGCKYIEICGGCRARAYSATGDWLEEDPYCLLDVE